jgi:hypothetical protein
MKSLLLAVCGVITGLSLILTMSLNASDQDTKNKSDKAQQKETTTKQDKPQKEIPELINHLPIYKPPLRGAPAGRVAAGTRGTDQEIPYLCLIVPEHVGLTISSQPTLYFYLSKISAFSIEFTLIEKQGINPIVEKRITSPKTAGIQPIRLADYSVHLEPGIQYKWFIALVPAPKHRSKDILASGGIEHVPEPENIKSKLANTDIFHAAYIYAEGGLWYDAFDTLCLMIEKFPGDVSLITQRNTLLKQIGLDQVIE